jgi:hypothetical protein
MNGPAFVTLRQPLPPSPDAPGIAGYPGNIPSGTDFSAYKITADWGDGTPPASSPTLYNEGVVRSDRRPVRKVADRAALTTTRSQ